MLLFCLCHCPGECFAAADDIQRFQHHWVVLVEVLDVLQCALGVVDDVGIEIAFKELAAAVEHQISAAQLVLLAIACEFVKQVLLVKVFHHIFHVLAFVQFLAVIVREIERKLAEQSGHDGLLIIRCKMNGVLGNEEIGHYTSASVDSAAQFGLVFWSVVLDAVL